MVIVCGKMRLSGGCVLRASYIEIVWVCKIHVIVDMFFHGMWQVNERRGFRVFSLPGILRDETSQFVLGEAIINKIRSPEQFIAMRIAVSGYEGLCWLQEVIIFFRGEKFVDYRLAGRFQMLKNASGDTMRSPALKVGPREGSRLQFQFMSSEFINLLRDRCLLCLRNSNAQRVKIITSLICTFVRYTPLTWLALDLRHDRRCRRRETKLL